MNAAQRAASRRRPPRPGRCPPPRSECSTRSCTSVSIRARPGRRRARRSPRAGRSAGAQHAGAQRVVDVVVDVGDPVDQPDDLPLERRRLAGAAGVPQDPVAHRRRSGSAAPARRRPAASARCGGSRGRSARAAQRSSTSSPMWPNGGWPRSWPSPIASVEVLVEPQRARDRARDLRRLQRVGEPRPVVVALRRHEHLRLVLEPPERLASARSGRGRAGTACAAPQSPPAARARRDRSGRRAARACRLPRLLARGEGVGRTGSRLRFCQARRPIPAPCSAEL